jgi:hypothetical protein
LKTGRQFMADTIITFNAKEIFSIEEIIMDKDGEGALQFLKDCVWNKIKAKEKSNLKKPV